MLHHLHSLHYCLSILLGNGLVGKRPEVIASLNRAGVGTSVYYPAPVPHHSYYRGKYGYEPSQYPVAARISYGSVALPVGPHLNTEDMGYIVDMLKKAISENI